MAQPEALIRKKRDEFHAGLIAGSTLTINDAGVSSNADSGNRLSIAVAGHWATALQVSSAEERAAGQTLGDSFEVATQAFLQETFPALSMLRPGRWKVVKVGRSGSSLAQYEPYQHLAVLAEAVRVDPQLAAVLGNAYLISPDVVVLRDPEPDRLINEDRVLVDDSVATRTAIRQANQSRPILHAVVSCKWTLRSDRAQNARSEALNLIRNRKGRLPHVVVVTAEPMPSRLSSLALGTGDIDCVYHVALPELQEALRIHGNDENVASINTMVEGMRLKDISDLPLDLAV